MDTNIASKREYGHTQNQTLSDLKLDRFLVDPSLVDKKLIEKFKDIEEFQAELTIPQSKGKALRFMILAYDMNNQEICEMYPDIMTRLRECAKIAGFTKDKRGRFDSDVEQLIVGFDKEFNAMVIRYVRNFYNPDFLMYISYWSMMIKTITQSMSADNTSDQITKIGQNITSLKREINEVEKIIFSEVNLPGLKKALYKSMESEGLGLRPENIAKHIKNETLDLSDADKYK